MQLLKKISLNGDRFAFTAKQPLPEVDDCCYLTLLPLAYGRRDLSV
ncbi:hypothetical protein IQ272_30930 [Chroococcidiopsidales cyanobacterium LEGE 13417]|nr:hypothetical protein [Chroococcidiopsidales cyanobacterium LEGE 13417]